MSDKRNILYSILEKIEDYKEKVALEGILHDTHNLKLEIDRLKTIIRRRNRMIKRLRENDSFLQSELYHGNELTGINAQADKIEIAKLKEQLKHRDHMLEKFRSELKIEKHDCGRCVHKELTEKL